MKIVHVSWSRCCLLAAIGASATSALAGIHTEVSPPWTRPSTDAEAIADGTTYQEWDAMLPDGDSTPAGPNAPGFLVNPNVTGSTIDNAWDTAYPGDGAFGVGTDIYSFSGILNPELDVAGYGKPGNLLEVQVEIQTYGNMIDPSLLTVNGVLASSLAGYDAYQAYNDGGNDNGFGDAYTVDYVWNFTTTDASMLKLDYGWGVTSAAWEGAVVDTRSVSPAPEPAGGLLLAAGAGLLLRRRRRA